MSEDTFERDLRLVLRDLAPADAPASLREAVAAVPRTHPAPPRAARAANRQQLLAFAGIAAVVTIAIGLALALGGRFNANVAGPSPSAVPSASAEGAWVRLTYELAGSRVSPSAGTDGRTSRQVAETRLQAARIPHQAEASGTGFALTVPASDQAAVEQLVAVTGQVEFVPLGSQPVDAGATVDLTANPPLFGGDQIVAAIIGSDQTGNRTVDLTLSPTAASAFAAYTTAHIGEYFAVVLDGTALTVPVIQSSIPDGHVQIQAGGIGGYPLAEASRLITILESGPMPVPVVELSAVPATPPTNPWTPAPLPSQSSAPSLAPSPSDLPMPTATFPPTGNAVTDGCLNGTGPTLPDGYTPGGPVLEQDDGSDGAAMIVFPLPKYQGAPDMIWVFGCRYQRLADGSVSIVNGGGGGMLAQPSTPAFIDEAGLGNPPSADQVIIGQATSAVKRIVAEFDDGSKLVAQRSGSYWMVWSRTSSPLKRVAAYDAAGAEIWSGTWPSP